MQSSNRRGGEFVGCKHQALAKVEDLGDTEILYMKTVITYNKSFPHSKKEATLLNNRSLVNTVYFDFCKVSVKATCGACQ